MSHVTIEVPPLSRADIRDFAREVRKAFHWDEAYFPVVDIVDLALPSMDDSFSLVIEEKAVMGADHGRTMPDQNIIMLRRDVYDGACEGRGRDRMTIAHELGHLFIHSNLSLTRRISREEIPPFRSSEWQANCFGGELLVSVDHVGDCECAEDIVSKFGVSYEAAAKQWGEFKKAKII